MAAASLRMSTALQRGWSLPSIQLLTAETARSPAMPVRSTAWASCSVETFALAARFLSVSPLSLTADSFLRSLLARDRRRGRAGALAALDAFLLVGVPAEGAADAELAELVADHVLGDEDVEEGAAVVHLEGVPDELG